MTEILRLLNSPWAFAAVLIGMACGALVVTWWRRREPLPKGTTWQLVASYGGGMLLGGALLGFLVFLVLAFLGAAGPGAPVAQLATPTATPTATIHKGTALPTVTRTRATATPTATIHKGTAIPTVTKTRATATPTPTRTSTPVPPTATATPAPPTPTPTPTPTSTATPTGWHVITHGGRRTVKATFTQGKGECGYPESWEDIFEFEILMPTGTNEISGTIDIYQPSTDDRVSGPINLEDGSFMALSPNEAWDGWVDPDWLIVALYAYTDTNQCKTEYEANGAPE